MRHFWVENRRKGGNPSVISHEGGLQQGLVRAREEASSAETHRLLTWRIRRMTEFTLIDATKFVTEIDKCW